jgi:hypothetical protein
MTWRHVSWPFRIVCALFGGLGVYSYAVMLGHLEQILRQPLWTQAFMAGGAVGILLLLFIAIAGRLPGAAREDAKP